MKHWWHHVPMLLTPEECDAVVEYALQQNAEQATVSLTERRVDTQMRRSTVRWLKRDDPALVLLMAKIQRASEHANRESFGFDLRGFESLQFTEYAAGNRGHYDWHIDNAWRQADALRETRKLSMVIQLSEPRYIGGNLELENDPLPAGVFTRKGSAIFFPSFNRHRVTPVTAGVRYSLVCWFVGPPFR